MHHIARSFVPAPVRHFLPRTLKRVVIVGGGPTGLFCADRLRHHFEVTVVDSKQFFEFTPSVLRAVVDPSHLSRITFDYRDVLERELGVEFVLGDASNVATNAGGSARQGTVRVAGHEGAGKLHFDYLIVAVGVGNGLWKPRLRGDPVDAALTNAAPAPRRDSSPPELTLDDRRQTLRDLHERIIGSRGVVVVGAGLVGVELAAELVHFFPQLKVTLFDGAADVLPQLGEGARGYARNWLRLHNVKLRLGAPFRPSLVKEDQVVLTCVGTRTRSAQLFNDDAVLKRKGQIRVNRHMQVLRRADGASGSSINSTTDAFTASDPCLEEDDRPYEMETMGNGRVFAIGDCAAVDGVPTAQMIFHGEEMAAVAVANIEANEDVASPFSLANAPPREMESEQPFLCCTSLGPHDGMFSTQTELVSTGSLAALQKQMLEVTKMGALRGELLSSLLWHPVH